MRVTNQQQIDLLLRQYQSQQSTFSRVSEHLASGKKVNRPSDEPLAYEQIMKFRNVLNNIDKRLLSVHEGASRLNLSESALANAESILQRSKEIALGQNNGTSSNAERQAISQEVHQLLLSFLDAANTKINDRYLFSGFETQTAPYSLTSVTPSGISPSLTTPDANQGTTTSSIAIQTAASMTGQEYKITFTSATTFDVENVTAGTTTLSSQTYTSGANIDFDGLRVVLTDNPGGPQTGDVFEVPPHNATDATITAGLTPKLTASTANTGATSTSATVFNTATLTGNQYTLTFDTPATTFDVVNTVTGSTVLNNATYTSGANIDFDGIRVVLTDNPGGPAAGDLFTIDPTDPTVLKPDVYEIRFTTSSTFDVVDLSTSQLLSSGNAYTSGNNIEFAGITTVITDGTVSPQAGDLFRVRPNYTYQGDTGSIAIEYEDNKTVSTNIVGSRAFSGPNVDLLDTLQDLEQALVTNTPSDLSAVISNLSTGLDQLTDARADLGSKVNRLDRLTESLQLLSFTTQDERSAVEDTDFAEASAQLATLETNLTASLLTLNQQFQISLLNFLR